MSQKEYCGSCRIALREWEWSGRGFCESCEETMGIEQQRKKFEAWAESVDIDIKKRWDGVYAFSTALYAWMAWQAAVKRCEPTPKWISIIDQLPLKGQEVIFTCLVDGFFSATTSGWWNGERTVGGHLVMNWCDDDLWRPCSHWMPLPDTPDDGKARLVKEGLEDD